MSRKMPQWMAKHPCSSCDAGYGQCAQVAGWKCCSGCDHPGRRQQHPYTADELEESWVGRDVDGFTRHSIERLRRMEARA